MTPSATLAAAWLLSAHWIVATLAPVWWKRVPIRVLVFVAVITAVLWPLLGTTTWIELAAVSVLAATVDGTLGGSHGRRLRPFLRACLGLFLVPGLALSWLLLADPVRQTPLAAWPAAFRDPTALRSATLLAAVALVTSGGTALVRGLLDDLGKMPSALEGERPRWDLKAGKVIGNLERAIA